MEKISKKIRTGIEIGACVLCSFLVFSCHSDGTTTNNNNTTTTTTPTATVTIDPSVTHQQMIGFGGALAWYSDRIVTSPNQSEITQLLFQDLGTDIIRMKSWYYPDNYPTYTGTDNMSDDNSHAEWGYAYQIYQAAKQYNPNMKVLLTSWGPPAGLKDNASSRQGALKSDAGGFMYDAFAQYWSDMLDHLQFNPDYISIQNEPSYINSGWTTSQWAPTEGGLPGYDKAFDRVYDKIKTRTNPPVMVGLESANIGDGGSGNTFSTFADPIKDRTYLGLLAYHPYNFSSTTTPDQTIPLLQMVATYSKPNIMGEFSDNFDWYNTAIFINNTLTQANSSGYIYWKLVWDKPAAGTTDAALISIDASGNYSVTPFYYLMKHYAKYIDAGYTRINVSSNNANINISGFINPAKTQLTLVAVNTSFPTNVNFTVVGNTITKAIAQQSILTKLYTDLGDNTGSLILLPSGSVTTVVLNISK